jgi:hypothetical protein
VLDLPFQHGVGRKCVQRAAIRGKGISQLIFDEPSVSGGGAQTVISSDSGTYQAPGNATSIRRAREYAKEQEWAENRRKLLAPGDKYHSLSTGRGAAYRFPVKENGGQTQQNRRAIDSW